MQKILRRGFSLALLCAPLLAQAVEETGSDRLSGLVHVHGVLAESACWLEMASAWQEVDMGVTGTTRLQHAGDQGTPVTVHLNLLGCPAAVTRRAPVMAVRFLAPADADNPQLVQVAGAAGFGLRLKDVAGRDITPGGRNQPALLTPGQATLAYTLTPVRTPAPLRAGAWRADIRVGLDYD